MQGLVAILLIASTAFAATEEVCNSQSKFKNDRNAFYDYFFNLHRIVSKQYQNNFVFSARSIGLMTAAMAEGADAATKQQLFKFLEYSEDWCVRQGAYKLASTSYTPDDNVRIKSASVFVADETLEIKSDWKDLVTKHSLLDVIGLPLKTNPAQSIASMEQMMSGPIDGINLAGNSVLLDLTEFNWTVPFADAVVKRSPFYNQKGEKTGYVDLMWMKIRVRTTQFPESLGTLLELPMGVNGRYRIFIAKFNDNVDLSTIVNEMDAKKFFSVVDQLKETEEPIDVAIPRMELSSLIDVRALLEDAGFKSLWTDEAATSFISNPPASTSSFIQRTTLTLDAARPVDTNISDDSSISSQDENSFIANRGILFSIYDKITNVAVVSASFTEPTFPK